MKTSLTDRIISYIIFMIAFVLLLLSAPLWASGDCKGNQPCGDIDVANEIITGDVSVAGDKSKSLGLGFGRSSFDVDINQCMGSTSWDTIVGGKQKLVINWVCLSEFYLKTGQPELAAVAICNTEILSEFDSEAECEAAHDFFVEVAEALPVVENNLEEEEFHHQQMLMQQEYEERIEQLEQSRRVVVQQPYLSDEKKQKLREIVNE
jgi:hypothetical protein